MADLDIEILTRIANSVTDGNNLTPAERAEVLRIARGFACKDSAASANVSPETVRARRKRIYRKLRVAGAGEVLSSLLAAALHSLSTGAPRNPELDAPRASEGAGASR